MATFNVIPLSDDIIEAVLDDVWARDFTVPRPLLRDMWPGGDAPRPSITYEGVTHLFLSKPYQGIVAWMPTDAGKGMGVARVSDGGFFAFGHRFFEVYYSKEGVPSFRRDRFYSSPATRPPLDERYDEWWQDATTRFLEAAARRAARRSSH